MTGVTFGTTVDFGASVSLGTAYRSDVSKNNFFNWKKRNNANKSGGIATVLDTTLDLFFPGSETLISYNLAVDCTPATPEFSVITQSAKGSIPHEITQNITVQHSAMFNYTVIDMEEYVSALVEGVYLGDLVWIRSEKESYFLTFQAGYYRSIDESTKFISGPHFGITLGQYLFPTATKSFIKNAVGFQTTLLRDEIVSRRPKGILGVSNKFVTLFTDHEFSVSFKEIAIRGSIGYSYLRWINIDTFNKWQKRRQDHNLKFTSAVEYSVTEDMLLSAYFLIARNFSSIGRDAEDYEDFNYTNYEAGMNFLTFF